MAGKRKFLIIDGSNLFYRAFYALPRLTASDGTPTGAIFGFVNSLQKVRDSFSPLCMCVVFDAPGPTFRDEIYPRYKETRQKMPEDMTVQLPIIKEIIDGLGLTRVEIEGVEADDVIGSLCQMAGERDLDTIVVSSDKDLCQLVGDRVLLYDSMKDRVMDVQGVIEKFGVPPGRIVDLIALSGDPSDNIPGVPGIGSKTAAALLKEFGSVDNLLKNLDFVKGKKREYLRENLEMLEISRRLASVKEDVSLPFEIEGLMSGEPDRERVRELFRRLGFKFKVDGEEDGEGVPGGEETRGRVSYLTVGDPYEIEKEIALSGSPVVALCPVEREGGWTIGVSLGEGNYVVSGETAGKLVELVSGKNVTFVCHDVKTAVRNCSALENIFLSEYRDTMLASYLLHPEESSLTLARMAERYTDMVVDPEFSSQEEESATCSRAVLSMHGPLEKMVEEKGFLKLYRELELPLVEVLFSMEKQGVRLKGDELEKLSGRIDRELSGIEEHVRRYSEGAVNLSSPKQVSRLLFEELELPTLKKTKTGFSTDVEVLDQLSAMHEVPGLILSHRTLSKLKSTYVDVLPAMVAPGTGRIHTRFNQMQTATGRLSSSNPNLQNIPVRTELGREIRRAFVPKEGLIFVGADYNQIELRVLAHLSGDLVLKEVFLEDRDVHSETALALFGVDRDGVTPELRRRAKVVNFGILYGMTPFGLAKELKISQLEAKNYIEDYFKKYPAVKRFVDETLEGAREKGYVETFLGRKRYLRDIQSRNQTLRQAAERMAINTPVQGSAADIIKLSMVLLHEKMKSEAMNAHMILQVHDELILEVEVPLAARASSLLKETMEGVVSFEVPLKVDVKTGYSWGELS